MQTTDYLILKQIAWAENRGLTLRGKLGDQGRLAYTPTLEDNLFQPLDELTRQEIEEGDGGELSVVAETPARMQAVHSSSAIAVNLFQYWRGKDDVSPLTTACRLSRAQATLSAQIQFERKFPIVDRFKYAPNLDVVIIPQHKKYALFGIECKFTEPYTARGHGGFDEKYFDLDTEALWQSLPATKALAETISPDDQQFQYLHAAQLIKHLLGLTRQCGQGRFRLLYLWYDVFGAAGAEHRQEVDRFQDIVSQDGVMFHSVTYQEVILHMTSQRSSHREYIQYLTSRYV